MGVDRCVCRRVTFAELKAMSSPGTTVEELSQRTGCGTGCGMCRPYVALMLRTGRTAFAPLPPHEAERVLAERRG